LGNTVLLATVSPTSLEDSVGGMWFRRSQWLACRTTVDCGASYLSSDPLRQGSLLHRLTLSFLCSCFCSSCARVHHKPRDPLEILCRCHLKLKPHLPILHLVNYPCQLIVIQSTPPRQCPFCLFLIQSSTPSQLETITTLQISCALLITPVNTIDT
jgi:hypothetical protein